MGRKCPLDTLLGQSGPQSENHNVRISFAPRLFLGKVPVRDRYHAPFDRATRATSSTSPTMAFANAVRSQPRWAPSVCVLAPVRRSDPQPLLVATFTLATRMWTAAACSSLTKPKICSPLLRAGAIQHMRQRS